MAINLPDIDQQSFDDYEKERLQRELEQKQQTFSLQNAIGEKIAGLQSIAGGAANAVGGVIGGAPPAAPAAPLPAPAPEPPPEPAPAPPEPLPAPEPQPPIAPPEAPAAAPAAIAQPAPELPSPAAPPGVGISRASPPPVAPLQPTPPPPAPVSGGGGLQAWIGSTLGAVSRAGGDVGKFAQSFDANAADPISSALGAASRSGADISAFASSLTAPPRPQAPAAAPGLPQPPPGAAAPAPGGDLVEYARNAAARYGVDPDIFVRQIQQESGFKPGAKSGAGAIGIAQFMPGTARGMGIDPTDPYAALDAAAKLDAQNLKQYGGYDKMLAAYNAGGGAVAKYGGVPPFEETQRYVKNILSGAGAAASAAGQAIGGAVQGAVSAGRQAVQDISQFGDKQLTNDEAYAACGPAAAVRFASMFGRNPSLREATDLAKTVGWTAASGMAGLGSEKSLMDKLGVATKLIAGGQWDVFAKEAQSGNPVTISTPGHYFFADGYDPTSGAFHVGRSGTDLKGGSEWMTPEQIQARMGAVQGGLLADNPQVPAPSVATTSTSSPAPSTSATVDDQTSPLQADQPLTDRYGRLTAAATGRPAIYNGTLQAASVGEPTPIEQPQSPIEQPQSPVDKLKSAFGDFVDSLQKPPQGLQDFASGTGEAGKFAPSSIMQGAESAAGQALQPGGALSQVPVLGGLSEMVRPTVGMSDQEIIGRHAPDEVQSVRDMFQNMQTGDPNAEPVTDKPVADWLRDMDLANAYAGTHTTPGNIPHGRAPRLSEGAVPATGAGQMADAFQQLDAYPTWVRSGIEDFVNKMPDAPPSEVASTVYRWMQDNPLASVAEHPGIGMLEQMSTDLEDIQRRAGIRSGGVQPEKGQIGFGEDVFGGQQRTQPLLPDQEWQPMGSGDFDARKLLPDYVPTSELEARQIEAYKAAKARIEENRAARIARGEPDIPERNLTQTNMLGTEAQSAMQEGGGRPFERTLQDIQAMPETPSGATIEQLRLHQEQLARDAERAAQGLPPLRKFDERPADYWQVDRYGNRYYAHNGKAGDARIEVDLNAEERALAQLAERFDEAGRPTDAGAVRQDIARGVDERTQTGLREQTNLPGTVAEDLNLPKYVPDPVQQLVQDGHQAVPDRAAPIDWDALAAKTGSTTERLKAIWNADKPGEDLSPVRAASQAMDDSAERLVRAQEKLALDPKSADSISSVVTEMARFQSLQEFADRRLAKAGSMLSDLKEGTASGMKNAGDVIERMAERAKMPEDEFRDYLSKVKLRDETTGALDMNKVASLARVTRDYTFMDKAAAVMYFNLLMRPTTHIRNIAANLLTGVTRPLEYAGAAAMDLPARKLLQVYGARDTGRQRYIQEVPAMYRGLIAGLPDAKDDALNALKYGVPGKGGDISRLAHEPFEGTKGEFLGYTGRALEAEDQFSRAMASRSSLYGQAERLARQTGLEGERLQEEIVRVLKNPSTEMLDEAGKQAEYSVFQQSNKLTTALNQAADAAPALKFLMPFVRTPYNIAKYIGERSPLGYGKIGFDLAAGVVSPKVRQDLVKAGAGDLADRLSRAGMGSTVFGSMVAAKMMGGDNITGRAPKDPVERDQWEREGKTPYSFRAPDGRWYSYEWVQPYSTVIGAAVDTAQAIQDGTVKDPSDLAGIAAAGGLAMGRGLLDSKFGSGLAEVLDLMQKGSNDPGRDLTRLASKYSFNAVPGASGWRALAQMTDNVVRDPDNVLQGIAANMPGLSKMVPADLTAWGEERTRPNTGAGSMFLPGSISEASDDPVESELARLQKGGYGVEPGFVGRNVQIGLDKAKLDATLTKDQQREYQQVSGQRAYTTLAAVMGSKTWEKLPDEKKVELITKIVSDSREMARLEMTPDLLPGALDDLGQTLQRRESVRTPAPVPGAAGG